MNDKILNQQNTMLHNGKLYELSITKDDEPCQRCAFANVRPCPGKCTSRINEENFDGFWIEKQLIH